MKKRRITQDDRPKGLTHNPFAALRPDAAPRKAPADAQAPSGSTDRQAGRAGRVVVQREKKGRAGKTVTRVIGLELGAEALAELARDLKRALGCGASVEQTEILLQGAQTDRVAALLRERLEVDVTIGN